MVIFHLDQGPDEEAGDDGEEGAGNQLQEEAVEPHIKFVQKAVMRLRQRTPLKCEDIFTGRR